MIRHMSKTDSKDQNQKHIAARLKQRWLDKKVSLGLNQKSLAQMMGINQSAVSQYLNGDIPLSFTTALKMCAILKIDPVEINSEWAATADLAAAMTGKKTGVQSNSPNFDDIPGYYSVSILEHAPVLQYSDINNYKEVIRAHHAGSKRLKELPVMPSCGHPLDSFYLQSPDDSNAPQINKDDFILVDTAQTPQRGQFVLVASDIGPMVGRIAMRPQGRYTIELLDRTYSEDFDDTDQIKIYGTAVGVFKSLV